MCIWCKTDTKIIVVSKTNKSPTVPEFIQYKINIDLISDGHKGYVDGKVSGKRISSSR